MTVTFVDTTVLCNLLAVPFMSDDLDDVRTEAAARQQGGERFVIPITAIIETGNHIAQVSDGHQRRAAAERFVRLIESVRQGVRGWVLHEVDWDGELLAALTAGDSTGQSFVDLAGHGILGAGDVAILVERDRYIARSAHSDARIWTLDAKLQAYS